MKDIGPGAQTERRGDGRTGRLLGLVALYQENAGDCRESVFASEHFIPAAPAVYYLRFSGPPFGATTMALTIEAIYANGVLKPLQALPLKENERVQVTIHPSMPDIVQAYGIMGWKGDAETLRRIALDPEFLPEEDS